MNNILVVNSKVPFFYSGAELLEEGLIKSIKNNGYRVDILRIIEKWDPPDYVLKMMMQARLIDINNLPIPVDKLITLKFPSYYVKHQNKVVWFLHHYRVFYEVWDSPFLPIPKNDETEAIREMIISSDTKMLKEAKKVFAISKTVAERLKKYNGINSEVLYPPVENSEIFSTKEYDNFFFFPSRITPLKRQILAVSAMSLTKSHFNLIIAGKVENEEYLSEIRKLVYKNNLEDRVLIMTDLSKEEIVNLYSRCLAVVFPSYQEDYGYITLEAMYSKKAVITCTDSGGPTEFVENKVNGLITEPSPEALSEAMESIYLNKKLAIEMGKIGYEKINSLEITWNKVVERLINE